MTTDPIIEEIHNIRDEYAKQFNYNLLEIFNDLKEQEKKKWKTICILAFKKKKMDKDKEIME